MPAEVLGLRGGCDGSELLCDAQIEQCKRLPDGQSVGRTVASVIYRLHVGLAGEEAICSTLCLGVLHS